MDMDAFFAAVEQLDHPEWRGRPVIVGGSPDGRGVVSTASYEAREFGVRSAMPAAQAARRCPDAVWVWPRMDRYAELSAQVREIFRSVTPFVEPVSIDEAFLDVTPGQSGPHPVDVARAVKDGVAAMGLSASVGVAACKTVAKIASDMDKPDGLTVVPPGEEAEFLAGLHVGRLPGVGPVMQRRLADLGITRLGELAALDDDTAEAVLGSVGPSLVRRARGVDPSPVTRYRKRKSVSCERTLASDVTSLDEAKSIVKGLSRRLGSRLVRKHLGGRTVFLKVKYADFTVRTAQTTLGEPVGCGEDIEPVALELLVSVWRDGDRVRLLGVGVSGLETPAHQVTLDEVLTERGAESGSRWRRVEESVEELSRRFGPGVVRFGARRLTPATPDKGLREDVDQEEADSVGEMDAAESE
ncbi:MAG: DNA polymerase IV [Coriobacteriia bacterium]